MFIESIEKDFLHECVAFFSDDTGFNVSLPSGQISIMSVNHLTGTLTL